MLLFIYLFIFKLFWGAFLSETGENGGIYRKQIMEFVHGNVKGSRQKHLHSRTL